MARKVTDFDSGMIFDLLRIANTVDFQQDEFWNIFHVKLEDSLKFIVPGVTHQDVLLYALKLFSGSQLSVLDESYVLCIPRFHG